MMSETGKQGSSRRKGDEYQDVTALRFALDNYIARIPFKMYLEYEGVGNLDDIVLFRESTIVAYQVKYAVNRLAVYNSNSCFDMMLMRLCAKRGVGPGFLVHDSHLFDGVDGRQVVSGLKVGAEMAKELGFQYIVTMNEDDAFKEKIEGFELKNHMLPVVLTDAREDGGIFGFRF